MTEDTISLWVPVWGDSYIKMLEEFAAPSVMYPDNLPACGHKCVFIDCFTRAEDIERMTALLPKMFSGLPHEIRLSTVGGDGGQMSLHAIQECVRRTRERKNRMLIVMPDMIFGNGSIRNIVTYARHKPVTVACAHLRVSEPQFLQHFPRGLSGETLSNRDLVDLSLKYPHQASYASWFGQDNGTANGGISMGKLSDGVYSMIHHLPSPFLAFFNNADVRYFNRATSMGVWDHHWPQTLISGSSVGRMRVIGSSDMFFVAEMTRPDSNCIDVVPGSQFVESYYRGAAHHALCGHLVTTLMGNV